MKYELGKDYIKVFSKKEFNPQHILECGQVFCFKKEVDKYIVFPGKEYAEIFEACDGYLIKTKNPQYFVKWFDLNENYNEIKENLSKYEIMKKPIEYGGGIRILKQDLFETLISFIISANNNIKRICMILNKIRENLGKKVENGVYSFPSYEKLQGCDEVFFKSLGAGYRAAYLVKVLSQTNPDHLETLSSLSTKQLRKKLIGFAGVGPKVADCILLFGYGRKDVFPVDTWIAQMYNCYFEKEDNREKIRNNLVDKFGNLSGQAQQYLFYYQRAGISDEKQDEFI